METTISEPSQGLLETVRARINPWWIRANRLCAWLFGGPRHSWIIDPMYLYWSFYTRNLREVCGHARGLLLDIGSAISPSPGEGAPWTIAR